MTDATPTAEPYFTDSQITLDDNGLLARRKPDKPWMQATKHGVTLVVGELRERLIPSVAELMNDYPHLEAWEARFWALRERKRLLSRKPIPPKLRAAVFARDGHKCATCGAIDDLTLDHIIPWSRCGPDTEDNLQVLCRSCNCKKGVN